MSRIITIFIFVLATVYGFSLAAEDIDCGKWSFSFDKSSGIWTSLSYEDTEILVNESATPPFNWGPTWPGGKPAFASWQFERWKGQCPDELVNGAQIDSEYHLLRHEFDMKTSELKLIYKTGDYDVCEIVHFGSTDAPTLLACQLEVTYTGKDAYAPLFGVSLNMPFRIANQRYFITGGMCYPDNKTVNNITDLSPIQKTETSGYSSRPLLLELNGRTAVLMAESRFDKSSLLLGIKDGAGILSYNFAAVGYLYRGRKQTFGPAYFKLTPDKIEIVLESGAIHNMYDEVGMTMPKGRPDDVLRDSIMYCCSPGGSRLSGWRNLGGFNAARKEIIPRLNSLGFNTVWFLPIEDLNIYHPYDYFKTNKSLGSADEYKELVRSAHASGMKVMQDIVPHGTNAEAIMTRCTSPEVMAFDKKGDVRKYLACDYLSNEHQEYMKRVAAYYGSEYGADMLRIDLADAGQLNWRKEGQFSAGRIPENVDAEWWKEELSKRGGSLAPLAYQRASLCRRMGGLAMSRVIREGLRSVNPSGAVMGEVQYSPYMTANDIIYDKDLHSCFLRGFWYTPLAQADLGNWTKSLSYYLEQQFISEPADTIRMRYTENHDCYPTADIVGVGAMRAATALTFFLDGIPMIYQDSDRGSGTQLKELIALRTALVELRRGKTLFLHDEISVDTVMGLVRYTDDSAVLCLINFSPDQVNVKIRIPEVIRERLKQDEIGMRLGPWDYSVIAGSGVLLGNNTIPTAVVDDLKAQKLAVKFTRDRYGNPLITTSDYTIIISNRDGLPAWMEDSSGERILDRVTLFPSERLGRKSLGITVKWDSAEQKNDDGSYTLSNIISTQGGAEIKMLYNFYPEYVRMSSQMLSDGNFADIGVSFMVKNATGYQVNSAEGLLDDDYFVARRFGLPNIFENVSWRRYNTPIIWQSEMIPLDLAVPQFACLKKTGGICFKFENAFKDRLANSMLLDRADGINELHAVFFYKDSFAEKSLEGLMPKRAFSILMSPVEKKIERRSERSVVDVNGVKVSNLSFGWRVEHPKYTVELGRTGGHILKMVNSSGNEVLKNAGLVVQGTGYCQESDIEASCRVYEEDGILKMLFSGVFKRFGLAPQGDRMQTPHLHFRVLYTFDSSSPEVGVHAAVLTRNARKTEKLDIVWTAMTECSQLKLRNNGGIIEGIAVKNKFPFQSEPRTGKDWQILELQGHEMQIDRWYDSVFYVNPAL
ncbi:MAG: hypothetical protein GX945_03570 [Lentisphaerae bacterium]|nr:hypothetical protein [Lentisphaerota bacterium]